ncbi:MAG: ABC transporter permease subunit, partial [Desulfofustis sp.]
MKIFGIKIPMMASLIFWAILWEIVGQLELSILLPPFSHIIIRMIEVVPTATFLNAFLVTAQSFLIGVVIAIVLGIPIGVLMGRSIVIDRMLLPWVNMFLSAPLTALVPVLMTLFGFGMKTIILTTVLFAIWIIVLDARAGVKNITPSLIDMAKSFQANYWQAFTKVYVWAALPEILAGIRLGCIRAVKGVIIGQLLVSVVGFGR